MPVVAKTKSEALCRAPSHLDDFYMADWIHLPCRIAVDDHVSVLSGAFPYDAGD